MTPRRMMTGVLVVLMVLSPGIAVRAQQPADTAAIKQAAPQPTEAVPRVESQAPPASPAPAQVPIAQVPVAQVPAAELSAASEAAARPAPGVGPLQELSPWSMFLSADLLVKAVMIGLFFASLVTWTILIAKTVQLSRARRQVNEALARIAPSRSLREAQVALGTTDNVLGALLAAATEEIAMSRDSGSEAGIKERAASRFSDIVRVEARAARYGMSIIATIGATAPFVGLFGTVWGIMNSFIGISKAQTTNLAVVAPGIAEALLATAVGLAAAIPAVIIYNHFSRATKAYLELVGRGSGAVGRLLSRDIDRFNNRMIARAAE